MPEESVGHGSEESLPRMLGTARAVSPGPLRKPVCQRSLHSQTLLLLLSSRRLSWEASVWCGQETLLSPSLLLSGIVSLGNNKEEGASRLLLHGLGTLLSVLPQVPAKDAKPLLMFISD